LFSLTVETYDNMHNKPLTCIKTLVGLHEHKVRQRHTHTSIRADICYCLD